MKRKALLRTIFKSAYSSIEAPILKLVESTGRESEQTVREIDGHNLEFEGMKEKLGSQKSEMFHKRTSADEALRVHEEKWKALQAEKDTLVAAFNEEIESGAHILQSLKIKKEEYKTFTNVGVLHSKGSKPPDLLSAESMERRRMKKQKLQLETTLRSMEKQQERLQKFAGALRLYQQRTTFPKW